MDWKSSRARELLAGETLLILGKQFSSLGCGLEMPPYFSYANTFPQAYCICAVVDIFTSAERLLIITVYFYVCIYIFIYMCVLGS